MDLVVVGSVDHGTRYSVALSSPPRLLLSNDQPDADLRLRLRMIQQSTQRQCERQRRQLLLHHAAHGPERVERA